MGSVLLVQGDARHIPLADQSVHMVCTSPPYWGLRTYGIGADHGELGIESLHDCNGAFTGGACGQCYACHLRAVAAEIWRVLRDDGTLWLNLGDSFSSGGRGTSLHHQEKLGFATATAQALGRKSTAGVKPKNLLGIPWRVALALQQDGWILRSDIIWCLSGGTWVYVRTQKGDMPMMIKDLQRLREGTVQLWNGKKWTPMIDISQSQRNGNEIELVLRSGERISCTPIHQFPTARGLLQAKELCIGDTLQRTKLPEPACPLNPLHIDYDAAWLAGLYVAEGSMSGETIQISGHVTEESRWERVRMIATAYGGSAKKYIIGNSMEIHISSKLLRAILAMLVTGKIAKDKGIAPIFFRFTNEHLRAWLEGYCSGDAHWDAKNNRYRLNFTRNYNLERDLRTVCARLGYHLVLNLVFNWSMGKRRAMFRGEIRTLRSGHHNEKVPEEIVAIRKARCRMVYDISVADEPHVFALASGILTHNSSPNKMPESVQDRPTRAHEHIFLFAKQPRYFFDAVAIAEEAAPSWRQQKPWAFAAKGNKDRNDTGRLYDGDNGTRNARDVWTFPSAPFGGEHYAAFPPELARRCILAGTSAAGCCPQCQAPWVRQVERSGGRDWHQDVMVAKGIPGEVNGQGGNKRGQSASPLNDTQKIMTTGWLPSCRCDAGAPVSCTVFDPFAGSGTTGLVARALGRQAVLCDLSYPYLHDQARHRLQLDKLDAWTNGVIAPAEAFNDLPLFKTV